MQQQPQRRIPAVLEDPLGAPDLERRGDVALDLADRALDHLVHLELVALAIERPHGVGDRRRARRRAASAGGSSAARASSRRPSSSADAASLPTGRNWRRTACRARGRAPRRARAGALPIPLPARLGMHEDQRVVAEQLGVGDDLAADLRHPGVLGEVDAGGRPEGAHVVESEVGLADVGDVARHHHAQDRFGVRLRAGRADHVCSGQLNSPRAVGTASASGHPRRRRAAVPAGRALRARRA